MSYKLILQLHVHSEQSHDSKVSVEDYVNYLEGNLKDNEYAVLGVTDHNSIPLKTWDALRYSTRRVLIIPGIQWKLYKTFGEALIKLCTRREVITLGDHDGLIDYIKEKTCYSILDNGELAGNFTEDEFVDYISSSKNLAIVIPHPRHLFFDYYGKKEIKNLYFKIRKRKINHNFFVEEKTGYDPFPRLFYSYKEKYPILGSSDAHRIYSFFNVPALFSVETSIESNKELIESWETAFREKNLDIYKKLLEDFFILLKEKNKTIIIKKYYLRSILHFLYSIPSFVKRRFVDFPRNLTR
jgi:hypothetical protein